MKLTSAAIFEKLRAAYRYVSDAGHRRALALVVVGLGAHFSAKLAGLDVETVDAALSLLLPPVAYWGGGRPVGAAQ